MLAGSFILRKLTIPIFTQVFLESFLVLGLSLVFQFFEPYGFNFDTFSSNPKTSNLIQKLGVAFCITPSIKLKIVYVQSYTTK
jgi:hypothetical protein